VYVEAAQSEKQLERYQLAALPVARLLSEMLRNPEWNHILDGIHLGTTGNGHFPMPDTAGETDLAFVAVTGKTGRPASPGLSGNEKKNGKRKRRRNQEIPGHKPIILQDSTRGKPRTIVRHSSRGLGIAFTELESERKLYEFSPATGVLEINVRHPYFVKCDEANLTARRLYFGHIATHALTMYQLAQSLHGDHLSAAELYANELLRMQVFFAINEATATRRTEDAAEADAP